MRGIAFDEFTTVQAVNAIRVGDISAEAYATARLAAARDRRDLNAFVTLADEAELLNSARSIDLRRRNGQKLGALAGIPIAVKDNIDSAAFPTTAATPGLAANRPGRNAPIIDTLLAADALLLGKANMHELAMGVSGDNAAYGPVRNPYSLTSMAGGSSGGNAAAVAGRITPAGIGSDTGGSIRIPAALCGVAGFRPTTGRYPTRGLVPLSRTRDTPGFIARSVEDLALLDEVVTGLLPQDRLPLHGMRLGLPRQHLWEDLDEETARVAWGAIQLLRAQGAIFVEGEIECMASLSSQAGVVSGYEARVELASYLAEAGEGLSLETVERQIASPDVAQAFSRPRVEPLEYDLALRMSRPRLKAAYDRYFRETGTWALAFPTTPLTARTLREARKVGLNGRELATFRAYTRNTEPGSFAGLPGLTLPAGVTSAGLPVGLALDAPAGSDRRLIAIGVQLEAALGRLPPPAGPQAN